MSLRRKIQIVSILKWRHIQCNSSVPQTNIFIVCFRLMDGSTITLDVFFYQIFSFSDTHTHLANHNEFETLSISWTKLTWIHFFFPLFCRQRRWKSGWIVKWESKSIEYSKRLAIIGISCHWRAITSVRYHCRRLNDTNQKSSATNWCN